MKLLWIVGFFAAKNLLGAAIEERGAMIEDTRCHIVYNNLKVCQDFELAILKSENPLEAGEYIPLSDLILNLRGRIHQIVNQGKVVESISLENCFLCDEFFRRIYERVFQNNDRLQKTLEMLTLSQNRDLTSSSLEIIKNILREYPHLSFLNLTMTSLGAHIAENPDNIEKIESIILLQRPLIDAHKIVYPKLSERHIQKHVSFYEYKDKLQSQPFVKRFVDDSSGEDFLIKECMNMKEILFYSSRNLEEKYKIVLVLINLPTKNQQLNLFKGEILSYLLTQETDLSQEQQLDLLSGLIKVMKEIYEFDHVSSDFQEGECIQDRYLSLCREKIQEILDALEPQDTIQSIPLKQKLGRILVYLGERGFGVFFESLSHQVFENILQSCFATYSDREEAQRILSKK